MVFGMERLSDRASSYLKTLCVDIPSRRVGSQGNRDATAFFSEVTARYGFDVQSYAFDCLDWETEGATLTAGDQAFHVLPSPYALGCRSRAPLTILRSVDELEMADLSGKIALLKGEISKEQVMPKHFPFYNPEAHRKIVGLLEEKRPEAIITATSRDPAMVGGQYPFPLFEDGDFDIPSVYCTDVEGERLSDYLNQEVVLESHSRRIPSTGENVIARKGDDPAHRIVLVAHIDARIGTPGANDNASGVVSLLLLAGLLETYSGRVCIEIVAMNGEDYYSNPGEQLYIDMNRDCFNEIILAVNLDDVGYGKGKVAYSIYECSDTLNALVDDVFSGVDGMVPGDAWIQGDHTLFVMNGSPALAMTTDRLSEAMAEITHTERDTFDTVSINNLRICAESLYTLLLRMTEGSMPA